MQSQWDQPADKRTTTKPAVFKTSNQNVSVSIKKKCARRNFQLASQNVKRVSEMSITLAWRETMSTTGVAECVASLKIQQQARQMLQAVIATAIPMSYDEYHDHNQLATL